LTDPTVRDWHQRISQGGQNALAAAFEVVGAFTSGNTPEILLEQRFARSMWQDYFTTMDKHNEPGRFTALVAYEWTSTPDQNNLHRNVIYRDGADKALQVLPTTVAESLDPESLWAWMGEYEARTGGSVLAIPHNGNLSNGLMFPLKDFKGKRLTEAYARERARWEPLYEATQIKGDGEAHPFLSPNDEFANYETWDRSNLGSAVKEPGMLQWEYAREALKNGLKVEADLGINPFKFGMVGGTDAHTGLATAEEDNFFGKHTMVEPEAERWDHAVFEFGDIRLAGWEMAGSGLTAVWATENTREAIWDAMARREVYASTGPRISVRLFGGWDFAAEVAHTRLPANTGYARGVPMGGDLTNAPTGTAPSFLVAARKDPLSGNLDRIQIIKGWLDSKGNTHEQVYDVVWSDDREVGANGKVPAVGNTVDVGSATWTNTIGDPELITVWSDPDFDSDQRAFYYARVIEIPTPRWTAYEQLRFGIKLPENVPMTTQERAYTSPIWYTP
ncbi:MAG: DUF3604 domain-containing protein, partial [Gammaproteobacteria bacterium]|nr:DUF3604 domain-containing protein [Gammaproteobacteria bacterium]